MDRAKARARAEGLEIIDLSIGSSDVAPPEVALGALRAATYRPETYGYCLHTGYRGAPARGVDVDGAALRVGHPT